MASAGEKPKAKFIAVKNREPLKKDKNSQRGKKKLKRPKRGHGRTSPFRGHQGGGEVEGPRGGFQKKKKGWQTGGLNSKQKKKQKRRKYLRQHI